MAIYGEVLEVRHLTPRMVRVVLGGDGPDGCLRVSDIGGDIGRDRQLGARVFGSLRRRWHDDARVQHQHASV